MSLRYATRTLGAAVLAAALFAPASFAQQRQALPGVGVAYDGPVNRGANVLRHYDPENDTQNANSVGVGGYVFGTNGYGDLSKAVCFDLPDGQSEITVDQVNIYLFRAEAPAIFDYSVVLWEGMPGFDEDEGAGPQTEIYRQVFDITEIASTVDDLPVAPTEHTLDTPQVLTGPFCVAVEWDAGAGIDDIGIAHTEELAEPSPYEWEQWDDGSWFNMSDAWTAVGWHAWLDVLYTGSGTSSEDGAQPQRLALSSVRPNPVAGRASVGLEVSEARHVAVEVFDLLGRRVATVFEGTVAAGARTFGLDGTDLRPGLYVVRVQSEGFVESRRFVVAR